MVVCLKKCTKFVPQNDLKYIATELLRFMIPLGPPSSAQDRQPPQLLRKRDARRIQLLLTSMEGSTLYDNSEVAVKKRKAAESAAAKAAAKKAKMAKRNKASTPTEHEDILDMLPERMDAQVHVVSAPAGGEADEDREEREEESFGEVVGLEGADQGNRDSEHRVKFWVDDMFAAINSVYDALSAKGIAFDDATREEISRICYSLCLEFLLAAELTIGGTTYTAWSETRQAIRKLALNAHVSAQPSHRAPQQPMSAFAPTSYQLCVADELLASLRATTGGGDAVEESAVDKARDMKAAAADLQDMVSNIGADMVQFLQQNSPGRPAKMHLAYTSMLATTWSAAESAAKALDEALPELTTIQVFKLIESSLRTTILPEWVALGVQVGSYMCDFGAVPTTRPQVFASKTDLQNFLQLRPRYALQTLVDLYTAGGPLEKSAPTGTPRRVVVECISAHLARFVSAAFSFDGSIEGSWATTWAKAFDELVAGRSKLPASAEGIFDSFAPEAGAGADQAKKSRDGDDEVLASDGSGAPAQPREVAMGTTLAEIRVFMDAGAAVPAASQIDGDSLDPPIVARLPADAFSVHLVKLICREIESSLYRMAYDKESLAMMEQIRFTTAEADDSKTKDSPREYYKVCMCEEPETSDRQIAITITINNCIVCMGER